MLTNNFNNQSSSQSQDFYDSSISFWHKHQSAKPKYYFMKDRLNNNELVSEHIANNLYRLFGVSCPASYISRSVNNGFQTNFALVSEQVSGYADLSVYLGGKDAISSIADKKDVKDKIACFNDIVKQKDLNFIGKAQLLVACICLDDYDVLGVDFSNIGAVKTAYNKLKLINIDPGQANIIDNSEFGKNISLDNKLLKKELSTDLLNIDTIMGNRHFLEFFGGLSQAEIQQALVIFNQISDQAIKQVVIRDDYLELVDSSLLGTIAETIISRKNFLASLVADLDLESSHQPISLENIFKDQNEFSDPITRIEIGNSRPKILRLKSKKTLETIDVKSSKL